jgi:hypothetical protein
MNLSGSAAFPLGGRLAAAVRTSALGKCRLAQADALGVESERGRGGSRLRSDPVQAFGWQPQEHPFASGGRVPPHGVGPTCHRPAQSA